ncbi:hypothetical protein Tco_0653355 [Tanacetum coccineum]|uniref:Uncharacterized protein n=1 Tax=Tanacetum coccineum TaxID=301880 RepID=A0ABQ4X050_9ASTR
MVASGSVENPSTVLLYLAANALTSKKPVRLRRRFGEVSVYKFEGVSGIVMVEGYKQAKGGDAGFSLCLMGNISRSFWISWTRLGCHAEGAGQELFVRGLHKSILRTLFPSAGGLLMLLKVADAASNFEDPPRDRNDYDSLNDQTRGKPSVIKFCDLFHVLPYSTLITVPPNLSSGIRVRDKDQSSNSRNSHRGHDQWTMKRHWKNSGAGRDHRNRGQQSHRATNSGSQQNKAPSEGYTYPVCTTCGRRHPGECRRAAGGYLVLLAVQAGHIFSVIARRTRGALVRPGYADKKPDASGRVLAVTQDFRGCAISTDVFFQKNFQEFSPIRDVGVNIELIPEAEPSPRLLNAWLRLLVERVEWISCRVVGASKEQDISRLLFSHVLVIMNYLVMHFGLRMLPASKEEHEEQELLRTVLRF